MGLAKWNRARFNMLQVLRDANAVTVASGIPTSEVDAKVGDVSTYAYQSNYKIVQSLLRDQLVEIDFGQPMKIWLTMKGIRYLADE